MADTGLISYPLKMGVKNIDGYIGIAITIEWLASKTALDLTTVGKIGIPLDIKIPQVGTLEPFGTALFYFDIPVIGLDATYDGTSKRLKDNKKATVWHLRNGLNPSDPDGIVDVVTKAGSSNSGILFEIGASGLSELMIKLTP